MIGRRSLRDRGALILDTAGAAKGGRCLLLLKESLMKRRPLVRERTRLIRKALSWRREPSGRRTKGHARKALTRWCMCQAMMIDTLAWKRWIHKGHGHRRRELSRALLVRSLRGHLLGPRGRRRWTTAALPRVVHQQGSQPSIHF